MNVLLKSAHLISLDDGRITAVGMTDAFDHYIKNLVGKISTIDSLQLYKIDDEHKYVISHIIEIIEKYFNGKNTKSNFDSISGRLFSIEYSKQEQIEKMGKNVRQGSLVQALFQMSENEFLFMLTKTEHKEYMDESTYDIRRGFETDLKKVWKSCLIPFTKNDEGITFGNVKILLDNSATYWAQDFLELIPLTTAEKNTSNLLDHIVSSLKKTVKKNSIQEFYELKSAAIVYLRNNQLVSLENFISIVENYETENFSGELKTKALSALRTMPINSNKHFDRQFERDVKGITYRQIKAQYIVTENIELLIKDTTVSKQKIRALTKQNGQNVIEIETTNIELFNTFKVH